MKYLFDSGLDGTESDGTDHTFHSEHSSFERGEI